MHRLHCSPLCCCQGISRNRLVNQASSQAPTLGGNDATTPAESQSNKSAGPVCHILACVTVPTLLLRHDTTHQTVYCDHVRGSQSTLYSGISMLASLEKRWIIEAGMWLLVVLAIDQHCCNSNRNNNGKPSLSATEKLGMKGSVNLVAENNTWLTSLARVHKR